MTARRWLVVGVVLIVGVVGFLLFRPDTLLTEVEADESLEEAFTSTTTTAGLSSSTRVDDPATTTTTSGPAGPVQVSTGQFAGIEHSAEGTVTVYEQDGDRVLRFEDDTMIQNGPDLYVWLLAADSYTGGTPAEYIDLGTLKGTVGGQNYTLPEEYDPAVHRTVLVWCLRFSVPFAAAPLS
jgi:hypothetical protein